MEWPSGLPDSRGVTYVLLRHQEAGPVHHAIGQTACPSNRSWVSGWGARSLLSPGHSRIVLLPSFSSCFIFNLVYLNFCSSLHRCDFFKLNVQNKICFDSLFPLLLGPFVLQVKVPGWSCYTPHASLLWLRPATWSIMGWAPPLRGFLQAELYSQVTGFGDKDSR